MTDQRLIPASLEEEMRRSYLDYAMSVIVSRALPDVRDGLKPVQRRVLWTMHELGNTYDKPYKKSARVVGDAIGKYHPHGDQPVYEAIVRMVQSFSMREPLIDGQGNFGSVDGDAPAAMRYTEVRLAPIAEMLLSDIEKETVDFRENYDGSLLEPVVLPARFPNVLVNGAMGIAVGMSTNIPPHNLGEVLDATIYLVNHPTATVDDLMQFVQGPDFPTAGFICGRTGIRDAYLTGRGSVTLRARAAIDYVAGKGERERQAIVVTELPYQVNKASLLEKIAELVSEKKIEGIADLRDESDREGMRVVIELKRDADAKVVLNNLFKYTPMQSKLGIIMLAIVNGRPQVLNLVEMLNYFVEHRREVVRRRTAFELRKAEAGCTFWRVSERP
jgi:DNA gyrase subunit A (EC 5.99.1.3)